MNNFLKQLVDRKILLGKLKDNEEDDIDRLVYKAKYNELITVIDMLPSEESNMVLQYMREIKHI